MVSEYLGYEVFMPYFRYLYMSYLKILSVRKEIVKLADTSNDSDLFHNFIYKSLMLLVYILLIY